MVCIEDRGDICDQRSSLSERSSRSSLSTDLRTKIPRRSSSVRFGSVTTREFERIVGDHPDFRRGPPVAIGWNYQDTEEVSLDAHQFRRSLRRGESVDAKDLLPLTETERKTILQRDWSYSSDEIDVAQKEVQKVKHERQENNRALIRFALMKERAARIGNSCQQALQKLKHPFADRSSEYATAVEYF